MSRTVEILVLCIAVPVTVFVTVCLVPFVLLETWQGKRDLLNWMG